MEYSISLMPDILYTKPWENNSFIFSTVSSQIYKQVNCVSPWLWTILQELHFSSKMIRLQFFKAYYLSGFCAYLSRGEIWPVSGNYLSSQASRSKSRAEGLAKCTPSITAPALKSSLKIIGIWLRRADSPPHPIPLPPQGGKGPNGTFLSPASPLHESPDW